MEGWRIRERRQSLFIEQLVNNVLGEEFCVAFARRIIEGSVNGVNNLLSQFLAGFIIGVVHVKP